nr:two-component system response regulator [Acidobacteriota bacterium]
VLHHQERYDGKGYPRGLAAEEIVIGARVFCVADTLDAITSDRPYRAAQSFSAAKVEIVKYAGTQFDPKIVKVFAAMPENIWQDLRKQINSQVYQFSETHAAARVARV